MFENTKCEFGHQNPPETVLCESCGKPLLDEGDQTPLEMRYDGVARRSQKANPNPIDLVWNFFSSVKIAVYLIVITLLGSTLGTIYPQENTFVNLDPSTYYKENYGTLGHLYYLLGLSHTYESWWFILLLLMIGTSLVICSLDRVLPLYRALSKQQIRKHLSFILRQKASFADELPADYRDNPSAWVEAAASRLRKKGYKVYKDANGTALLAEKHRFSRWGPYINHIGLIIFLLAVLMRSIPGWHMDQYIAFPEGQPVKIPKTSYYLLNEKFTVDYYQEEEMSEEFREKGQAVPKIYETQAVLFRCTENCDNPVAEPILEEVHRHNIIVNKPLDYKGLLAYQFDYRENPVLRSVHASLKDKKTGEAFGSFDLSMTDPKPAYSVGPYNLELKGYYPDFQLDANGRPVSASRDPNAPAFIFLIKGPGLAAEGEVYMYFPRQIDKERFRQDEINGALGAKLEIGVRSMEDVQISAYTSYLNVRVDRAMPYIWTGAAISMIGLIMGFYWQHRRIWLRMDGITLSLGAHTNKNWFGLRKECADLLNQTGYAVEAKSLDKGGKSS